MFTEQNTRAQHTFKRVYKNGIGQTLQLCLLHLIYIANCLKAIKQVSMQLIIRMLML